MAGIPLNTFKTTTANVTTTLTSIYTAPTGVATVVLLAQVSNSDPANTFYATASFSRNNSQTLIVANTPIPINDASTLLPGKLILQAGDSFLIKGSSNNYGQLIFSYLETANE